MRTKRKPKGGIAATNKPDNPAIVNPDATNNTAVATSRATKCSHFGHGTPANATANHTIEPNPPAAVTMHPATTNDAKVQSRGDMVMTIGGSDSIDYGNLTILSLLSPPPPVAAEARLLSLNLLDGKISTRNTTVSGEITRVVKHDTNTIGSVGTIMDTATNADGATATPLPPDSVTPQKLNNFSTNEKCPSEKNTHPVSTKLTATATCSH
jgi:hypothetical protein